MALKKAFDEIFLEGTIQTVAESGIENTRTKQIAERAGFSEGTMFKKFPTKEILLRDTFLFVDKKISDIILKNFHKYDSEKISFEEEVYEIWHRIYRYLVENKEETLFLIRYRYSAFYSEKIRDMMAYRNGSFDTLYEAFEKKFGEFDADTAHLLINCAMMITICFIEWIIDGKIQDDLNVEMNVWKAVNAAIKVGNRKVQLD